MVMLNRNRYRDSMHASNVFDAMQNRIQILGFAVVPRQGIMLIMGMIVLNLHSEGKGIVL